MQLACDGFSRRKKKVFCQLLRDGGTSLDIPLCPDVGNECPGDGENIDSKVGIEV